jgi:hypothetical protein
MMNDSMPTTYDAVREDDVPRNNMDTESTEEKDISDMAKTSTRGLADDSKGVKAGTRSSQQEPLQGFFEAAAKLKTCNKQLGMKKKESSEKNRELREEIGQLGGQTRNSEKERGEREARFPEAQADALALLTKDATDAIRDNEVKNELKSIFATCRQWTKTYVNDSSAQVRDLQKVIRAMLGQNPQKRSASLMGWHAACDGRLSMRHFLTAMLARNLACRFFDSPVFYLGDSKHGGRQINVKKSLLAVQQLGTESA